jgi:hypothetical protein
MNTLKLPPVSDPAQESKPIWKECYPISDPTQLPDPSSLPNTAEADSDSESDSEAETESPETKSETESFSTLVAVATGKALAELLFARYFCKSVGVDGAMVGAPNKPAVPAPKIETKNEIIKDEKKKPP